MKKILMLAFTAAILCGFTAYREASGADDVTKAYLMVKECLLNSDSVNAATHAKSLSAELTKWRAKKVNIFMLDTLQRKRSEAIHLANEIAETKNINRQRKNFAKLSEHVWYWMQHQRKPTSIVYRQQCPMTGEIWLSNETAIKNPYYPKNMLTCGNITGSTE
ncbi:MAG: DUF3347 domain-containing protein [Pseudobacter sp.]|uniref:DUF3347 domain-containing protein n=1 Tax=Pseudobacter sp. TaxID=2045420 RepID=UPI003F80617B